jgi:hypothetical protein
MCYGRLTNCEHTQYLLIFISGNYYVVALQYSLNSINFLVIWRVLSHFFICYHIGNKYNSFQIPINAVAVETFPMTYGFLFFTQDDNIHWYAIEE